MGLESLVGGGGCDKRLVTRGGGRVTTRMVIGIDGIHSLSYGECKKECCSNKG